MKLPMKSPEHLAISVPLLWRDRPPASLPGEFFFPSYSGGRLRLGCAHPREQGRTKQEIISAAVGFSPNLLELGYK